MTMREFLTNPDWDTPFFKVLAHNDTGEAPGHQAGIYLPKDLRRFLPTLDERFLSSFAPTTDRYLRAEMLVGSAHLADGSVRYQFQTWRGERTPESRITDGLRPLRDRAVKGDLLLFQRRADAVDRFRLILVKKGTPEFREVSRWIANRRCGPLTIGEGPVTQSDLTQARKEIEDLAQGEFQVMRTEVARVETRQSRIARSSVFRERVRREYEQRCAVSGIVIATPNLLYEVESAHVVPVSEGGSDDIRNGLTLTQSLHWAFDQGLFGVLPNRKISIPRRVKGMGENDFLRQFEGEPIREAKTGGLRVHPDAFAWHLEHLVRHWD